MSTRRIEVFSADCPACNDVVTMIQQAACPSCEVIVLDMHDALVAERARELGVRSLPAVAIDSELAGCCAGRGPDESVLRAAGLGQPL